MAGPMLRLASIVLVTALALSLTPTGVAPTDGGIATCDGDVDAHCYHMGDWHGTIYCASYAAHGPHDPLTANGWSSCHGDF